MNTNPMLSIAIVVLLLASQFNYKKSTIDDNFEAQSSLLTVEYTDAIENSPVSEIKKIIIHPINSKSYKNLISNYQLTGKNDQMDFTVKNEQIITVDIDKAVKKSKPITKVTLPEFKNIKASKADYWQTVHSIESKQGKLLYRPQNKVKNCTYTTSPCGHHQLSVKALKDIGCKSLKCRKDRLDYAKSLEMSKKLLAKNQQRFNKQGYSKLEDYQKYLIHQQGASGLKTLLAAVKGEKLLDKSIKRNMASNSPYTYIQLKRMGSKLAAQTFMNHWDNKWEKEKRLVAGSQLTANDDSTEKLIIPTFSDDQIQLALNFRF